MNEVPGSLRKRQSEIAYQYAKAEGTLKPLSLEETVKEWQCWKLIKNRFPYDGCFQEHDLLIPIREISFKHQMTDVERFELDQIIADYAEPNYDVVFENMTSRRSIMSLYHIHFGKYYENREEFGL